MKKENTNNIKESSKNKSKTMKKKWTDLSLDMRKKIEKEFSNVFSFLKNIDVSTLPKKIREKIEKVKHLEKLNSELLALNSRLNKSIYELKETYKKNETSFKNKAKSFSDKAKEQIEKFKEKHYHKTKKELEKNQKYQAADFITVILEPLNNVKMAIEVGKKQNIKELNSYLEGFEMLMAQIQHAIESQGVKSINPKMGDEFNPKYHLAISTVKNKSKIGKIIEVKKQGYILHDRLLIPSHVIVGK